MKTGLSKIGIGFAFAVAIIFIVAAICTGAGSIVLGAYHWMFGGIR